MNLFADHPGRLFVLATLLPLVGFILLALVGATRSLYRPYRQVGGFGSSMYWLLGGDRPLKSGAYLVTACMALAAALGLLGLVKFLQDPVILATGQPDPARWSERIDWVRLGAVDTSPPEEWALRQRTDPNRPVPATAIALELGYKIDHLTALMFAMVTVIGTAIFIFSLGYLSDESHETVADHEVDQQGSLLKLPLSQSHEGNGPTAESGEHQFRRRGRFGRFFLYLSLFCFSMLNLIIADNLFQVFVSWELVGLCSFFLIGFYYERPSAARAANKAFIVNRIGDAGFLIGIMIAWSCLGTLNFEEMKHRLRSPERDTHGPLELGDQFVRVNLGQDILDEPRYGLPPREEAGNGQYLALFPIRWKNPDHFHGLGYEAGEHNESGFYPEPEQTIFSYDVMPYWLFVVMGLGIFIGCVGKSAQVPLQTWLPDAMEGPTPVSALIHAATMVAAGVYLVGRCFSMFAPEVLLVIAYTGAITLFISATIALVQTDIKRVLAYSTCSQLGYMMLALGIGGWVAGLLHLLTHAFFKALLFLCSGSVIHGCHHEQDLRKMGGLFARMPITALTMLVGVLAIVGTPFFSGWYSKDLIIQTALGYGLEHPKHMALFVLPLLTVAMTGFYMFRLWFLAFVGQPRDSHVHEHAHESPWVMTIPLVFLAVFSLGVAWGWPVWDVDASYLGHLLHAGEPAAVEIGFRNSLHKGHEHHMLAGLLALGAAVLGVGLAVVMYAKPVLNPASLRASVGPLHNFLMRKWYFDEVYHVAVVKPTIALARASAAVDKRPTENGTGEPIATRRFDPFTLDGWLNAIGQVFGAVGRSLRVLQTGQLRTYVLVLALTAVVVLAILTATNG